MEEFSFDISDAFYQYIQEDKSKYKKASEANYNDPDGDFLIGNSGGFLMNIDFQFVNTHLFSEAAKAYIEQGKKYIDAEIDSPKYTKFRRREEYRRKHGITRMCKLTKDGTVEPLRISGEHYNFLNYVEIFRLDYKSIIKGTGKKIFAFPKFFDSQYWYYKCKEFSKNNRYHLIVNKTRRGGFSYMEGKGSANLVNLYPRSVSLLAAWDKKYLTQGTSIAPMARDQLFFYENQTPFKRGLLSRDLEDLQLGFKNRQGDNEGYQSKITCVSTFNNANAAIGKDAQEIKAEELGNFPNFDEFMRQTEPTTRTGSFMTGHIVAFGTVNADNETNDIFEKNFYNPGAWKFMPFENVWDKDSRDNVCGFFKPYWWGLEGVDDEGNFAMDRDGNTNYQVAIKIVEKERKYEWDNKKSIKDYIDYCGQYANSPEEAFNHGSSNLFTSQALDDHILNIKNRDEYKFYRDGQVIEEGEEVEFRTEDSKSFEKEVRFITNERLYQQGYKIHPAVEDIRLDPSKDVHGCFRQYYAPIRINGEIPKNLYRVWIDPFGVDKENFDVKNSLGTIYVYMRLNSLGIQSGDILVGVYVGRTNKQEVLSKIAYNIARYYNATIQFENDRGQILQDFRRWKALNYLETEPTFAWDKSVSTTSGGRTWGVSVGSGSRKMQGLLLLRDWLYTKRGIDEYGKQIYTFHYIYDLPTLLELKRFKKDGNFDRVSTLIVGMLDLKELTVTNKSSPKDNKKNTNSIFNRAWFTSN